jgi:hypothetical protein
MLTLQYLGLVLYMLVSNSMEMKHGSETGLGRVAMAGFLAGLLRTHPAPHMYTRIIHTE